MYSLLQVPCEFCKTWNAFPIYIQLIWEELSYQSHKLKQNQTSRNKMKTSERGWFNQDKSFNFLLIIQVPLSWFVTLIENKRNLKEKCTGPSFFKHTSSSTPDPFSPSIIMFLIHALSRLLCCIQNKLCFWSNAEMYMLSNTFILS